MGQDTIHNIAFIHGDFPFGGAERVTMDIASFLKGKGYRIFVFATCFIPEKMPQWAQSCIEVVTLPKKDLTDSLKDAEFIHDYIKSHDIETVVVVAKMLKHIQRIKDSGCKIIYAHHNMPFHEAQAAIDRAWRKGRRNPLRFLEWVLISYPKYVLLGQARKREEIFYRETYSSSDRYVMLCDEYKDAIVRKLHLDPEKNKLRVIWNSEYIPEKINLDKKKKIIYCGRLSYADKRIDRLLNAWEIASKSLPEWDLTIIGEGKERKKLEKLTRNKKIPRVTFTGFTNKVSEYYEDASVLALVSTYEGWPLCLTEAQANGVIPIAFDSCAGIHRILEPSGKNGFLVKPFDIKKFAEAIVHVARMSEDERNQLRKNIIQKAKKEYSPSKIGAMWKGLFDEVRQ